jgi:hypothetical protein
MAISMTKNLAIFALSVTGFTGLVGFVGTNPAQAAFLNGDFNNSLTGWTALGNVQNGSLNGSSAAQLTSSGAFSSDIESFLGLSNGALNSAGNGFVTNGSALKQTFSAIAGTEVTFDWNFTAGDYIPFNDFAFTSLSSVVSELADVQLVGNYGNSGTNTFSWIIPTTGSYTLGFGVVNVGDQNLNSTLFVDNVAGDVQAVPTPSLLIGFIPMVLGAVKQRRKQKRNLKEAVNA